ncbi:hypothetical protein FA13DRAFT_1800523 [Coprinellus micaceus]|uniref:Uncharacterized protein n=1 Tax=Coprinellus micaceus TaxID=71717 RepID=A0A4Y7SH37_COPMI|nr:hypothetical protein FA13DRAFT_1800523 [Coprinellus micaceus]
MAPPLAGRPPFATDEPDAYYDDKDAAAPMRRAPPPKPDNPNKRTSAYDVYDTYLTANGSSPSPSDARPTSAVSTTSRNSGIGGIGMGLLAMDSDSDDNSDDEEAYERRRKAEQAKRNAASNSGSSPDPSKGGGAGNSRTAALAAAIHANTPSPPNSPPPSPPPPSPKPIAAPKPGYAAPTIATLGVKSPAPSEGENPFEPQHQQGRSPFDNPPQQGMRGPPGPGMPHPQHHPQQQHQQQRGPPMPAPIHGMPQPMQPHRQDSGQSMTSGSSHGGFRGPPPGLGLNTGLLPPNSPGGMISSPHSPITPPPGAMVRGMTPAPLAPPMTPIMPVFAVPTTSGSPGPGEKGGPGVKWDESAQPIPRKPIMRSNTEDVLLPRRGEKGDDFWRRFSMVAHLEEKAPGGKGGGSMWLRKTQSGTSRLSKWVWFIGLILLGAIGAAVGLGVYFTKDKPDHQQPVALSGEVGTQKADGSTSVGKGGSGGTGAAGSTVKHVSPTHTIDARGWVEAVVTPLPMGAGTLVYRNVNADVDVEEREEGGSPCPKATATNASGSGVHHREVLEMESEGRARREHVRQSTSRKRRF